VLQEQLGDRLPQQVWLGSSLDGGWSRILDEIRNKTLEVAAQGATSSLSETTGQQLADHIDYRPIGSTALFPAPPDDHVGAVVESRPTETGCEKRLADPGLPGQQHETLPIGEARVELCAQSSALALSPDDRASVDERAGEGQSRREGLLLDRGIETGVPKENGFFQVLEFTGGLYAQ